MPTYSKNYQGNYQQQNTSVAKANGPSGNTGKATVVRGQLIVPDRGLQVEFMFNPPDMTDAHNPTWNTALAPGASHPVYQYGAGGERIITFTLYLDGDRGGIGRPSSGRGELSIKEDINFYRSLEYPIEVTAPSGLQSVYAPIVLFSFGNLYQTVACIVKKAAVKVTYFTPKLDPVRATVAMELAEVVNRRITADEIYSV